MKGRQNTHRNQNNIWITKKRLIKTTCAGKRPDEGHEEVAHERTRIINQPKQYTNAHKTRTLYLSIESRSNSDNRETKTVFAIRINIL